MSGNRLHVLIALLALFALPAAFPPEDAAAVTGCPLSTLNCNGSLSSSDDAVRALTCSNSQGGAGVGYDLVSGTIHAAGSGGDGGGGGSVQAVDDYTIVGLPTGTPVTFTARLRVIGSVGGGCAVTFPSGDFFGRLTEGASNRVEVRRSTTLVCQPFGGPCCATGGSVDSTLRVTVAGTAGLAFRLTSEVGASGRFLGANVTGQLSFEGLPPGTTVVSCQGFRQDFPVPARPTSWGAVKVRYR